MRRKKILLLALLAVAAQAALPKHPLPTYIEGEVLVKYHPGTETAAKSLRDGLGLRLKRRLTRPAVELLELPSMMPVTEALALLRQMPHVEYAEPNFRRYTRAAIPNDPLFPLQWGLRNTGQPNFVAGGPAGVPGADLNLPAAWDANDDGTADRVGVPSVIVAVVDDAFDIGHEDLAANFLAGRDLANNDADPRPDIADQLHGTAVAGCVAARGDNDIGIASPAWNIRMLPLKISTVETVDGAPQVVLDSAAAMAAYEFARDNGARIINASFGGPGFSVAERDQIRSLAADDILFVAAGGNDDSNVDRGQLDFPANLDADNIIAVAATNRQDGIASFSQYGSLSIDVAAPGLQVVTTLPGNAYTTRNGITGTSFSAPYTAGIAGLIRSHVPGVTLRDVKSRLIESGEDGDDTKLRTVGGRIDADRALEMAPGPSIVIRSVALNDGGNAQLDPGETLSVAVTLRNDWRDATNVTATLESIANGPTSLVATGIGPAVALGNLAEGQQKTASFSVTVPAGVAGHRYIFFRVLLTADGGYSARRAFIQEVGRLSQGVTVSQAFASRDADLYDEFHAWHFDLAAPAANLTFTSTAPADIDLLIKRGEPPQYAIRVGISPEDPDGRLFCTSGTQPNCLDPATLIGGGDTGNESVSIPNAPAGTYHVVVVNFAQRPEGMGYTLKAEVSTHPPAPPGGGGGGGGSPAPALLLALLGAGLGRRQLSGS